MVRVVFVLNAMMGCCWLLLAKEIIKSSKLNKM